MIELVLALQIRTLRPTGVAKRSTFKSFFQTFYDNQLLAETLKKSIRSNLELLTSFDVPARSWSRDFNLVTKVFCYIAVVSYFVTITTGCKAQSVAYKGHGHCKRLLLEDCMF